MRPACSTSGKRHEFATGPDGAGRVRLSASPGDVKRARSCGHFLQPRVARSKDRRQNSGDGPARRRDHQGKLQVVNAGKGQRHRIEAARQPKPSGSKKGMAESDLAENIPPRSRPARAASFECLPDAYSFTPKGTAKAAVNASPATPSPMAVDWHRPLTHPLALDGGETLRTLRDAAVLIARRFGKAPESEPLERALELLLIAAVTGAEADRKAATDQVALVLKLRRVT